MSEPVLFVDTDAYDEPCVWANPASRNPECVLQRRAIHPDYREVLWPLIVAAVSAPAVSSREAEAVPTMTEVYEGITGQPLPSDHTHEFVSRYGMEEEFAADRSAVGDTEAPAADAPTDYEAKFIAELATMPLADQVAEVINDAKLNHDASGYSPDGDDDNGDLTEPWIAVSLAARIVADAITEHVLSAAPAVDAPTALDETVLPVVPDEPVFTVPLAFVLETYRDGDDTGWVDEFAKLRDREPHYMARLRADIKQRGLMEPILLGNDGRVWDGHHRLCAAFDLGLTVVPVEPCRLKSAAASSRVADTPTPTVDVSHVEDPTDWTTVHTHPAGGRAEHPADSSWMACPLCAASATPAPTAVDEDEEPCAAKHPNLGVSVRCVRPEGHDGEHRDWVGLAWSSASPTPPAPHPFDRQSERGKVQVTCAVKGCGRWESDPIHRATPPAEGRDLFAERQAQALASLPPLGEPHEFVGRLDRDCEVCKRPDRHPIHRSSTADTPAEPEGER